MRPFELGLAGLRSQLPGDHVEIAVVEDEHDEARVLPLPPVLLDGDEDVVAVHLHRAVADEREDRPVRVSELRRHGIGHRRAHGRQIARERAHHSRPEIEIPRVPGSRAAGVGGEDRALREALVQLAVHERRVDRLRLHGSVRLEDLPPFAHAALDLLAPAAIHLPLQIRKERPQGLRRVAVQVHLHRIADPEHAALQIDLHAASLTLLREELRVGERRAHHQQRVALAHHLPRRLGAEQTNASGAPGGIVGKDGLSQ